MLNTNASGLSMRALLRVVVVGEVAQPSVNEHGGGTGRVGPRARVNVTNLPDLEESRYGIRHFPSASSSEKPSDPFSIIFSCVTQSGKRY